MTTMALQTKVELTTLPMTTKGIVYCTVKSRPKGCIKPPPVADPFKDLSKNLVYVIKKLAEQRKMDINTTVLIDLANSTDNYKVRILFI